MIQPFQRDGLLLADIEAARADTRRFHLWWLGQSGFLVQWRERHLLFDPYLSDSLTRKYEATDKPHVRMTERVIDPGCLSFVDVVTASHVHTDHLDPETLRPVFEANPETVLIAPRAIRGVAAERAGIDIRRVVGLDAGSSWEGAGFRVHAVPAAHERLDRDSEGHLVCLGFLVEFGPWRIYHSGDTVRYDGMAGWLAPWRVNVALLPINGRLPERRVSGNLWGDEAALLAREIGAGLAVPCHYGLFEFNTAPVGPFLESAAALGQPVRVLREGMRWSSDPWVG